MLLRQMLKRLDRRLQARVDDPGGGANLKNGCGVHHILRRRAPVQVSTRIARRGGKLLDHGKDRIADDLGIVLEPVEVELMALRGQRDPFGRLLRDYPKATSTSTQC